MSDTGSMRSVALVGGLAALGAFAGAGCKITATFTCDDSTQCGAGGICEPNNLCAFPDPLCMSGARYGDYSGALSGVCVGDETAADAPGPPDAAPDARVDASPVDPCNDWTFTPAEFDPCSLPPPAGGAIELTGGSWTLDGSTGVVTDGATSFTVPHITLASVDVVSIDHLDIQGGATLRASGARPLVIAAWMYILIDQDGTLDVHSDTTARGPGSPSGGCIAPSIGQPKGTGDAGSGGAGFGANGGDGGGGSGGQATGGNGAPAGAIPSVVAAGCDGAQGPHGEAGGAGGGGVALISRQDLTVRGLIHAGGQGGRGSSGNRRGGAGGGSGGMIKLEADTVVVDASATLAANGGQGGGGASDQPAGDGVDGQPNANSADSDNHSGQGSRGGRGGSRGSNAGSNAQQAQDSGGGGGGGVGYIIYRGHTTQTVSGTSTQSPAALPF